jgi:hypothetical protein
MIKNIIILICILLLPVLTYSQNKADSLVKLYKLNFALPDLPAFKSLGTEPSNILRPSNVQDFSFVSSEFFNGKNLVIPSAFALEVSPILLMNTNTMTREEFKKNNALKTSRISLGTNRDSLNTTNISIGYRITLINKGDLRTDDDGFKNLSSSLEARSEVRTVLRNQYLRDKNILASDVTDEIEKDIDIYISENIGEKNAEFENRIKKYKKEYKESHWNASKFDLAFAIVGQSPDSILANVDFKLFSFWTTYGFPILKNKGQVLIGLNYQNQKIDVKNSNSFSLTNRNYFGSNRIKVFFEEQIEYDESLGEKLNLLLNLGAELNLKDGLWIDLNSGYLKNYNNDSSEFISQLRFRYTFPE